MNFHLLQNGLPNGLRLVILLAGLLSGWMQVVFAESQELPQWLPDDFPAVDNIDEALCVRYFLTPEQAKETLDAARLAFPHKEDWAAYSNLAKRKIQEGAGLSPWPRKSPLNPIEWNERHYPGYSVRNVAFESIPGFWVTGNLYVPDNISGKVPAVLHTHGHSAGPDGDKGWAGHGRFKADVQYRAATLARMGAVSLTIDMFGYGDSTAQLGPDAHRSKAAMPMQIWNAVRSLDYLQSLDVVDGGRLAVTGHSGGGTQAFLLAALDDRIKVSVPVAMVSARFFGGCLCESGRPIHLSREHFVNNAMIAAMAAPRPMLIISDGGDWTDQVPEVEFPFIREIYKEYGQPDLVQNVHLPEEGHNYGPSKRAAMYPFMARQLGLELSAVLDAHGAVDESAVIIENPELMRVFTSEHPVPDGALTNDEAVLLVLNRLRDTAGLHPLDLRCDGMVDPKGVDSRNPRLSWRLEGAGHNRIQTAWQVQVAGDVVFDKTGQALLWDSGKISGSDQLDIAYAGPEIGSSETVWWRVRVWDENDQLGNWSEAACWTSGITKPADWRASWITHPDQLKFNRGKLGYRSRTAESVHTSKWILMDLGQVVPVDEVVLRAVRHTVAERLGFPMQFLMEASLNEAFTEPTVLIDCRQTPLNQWKSNHRIDGNGALARYLRLSVPVLRDLDGDICLALSQIEVISNGINRAAGAEVQASDSVESAEWGLQSLVDGKDVPGNNPEENRTILLQKQFSLSGPAASALVHVTGLGQYVLKINGHRVGTRKLSPGWTHYDKTILYDSFEISDYLQPGDNRVEILLAGGMYSVPDPDGRYTKFIGRFRPLKALCQMTIQHGDGRIREIYSDDSWMARRGAVQYSHIYGGEDFDLREEKRIEAGPADGKSGWVAALPLQGDLGVLRGASHAAPAISAVETLAPAQVTNLDDRIAIYDLGQNVSMMPLLTASGESGTRIRITPAELLGADGRVDRSSCGWSRPAYWELVLDGRREPFTWEPEFFYHGARYLQVERLPALTGGRLPEIMDLKGLVVHSRAESVGDFSCSSQLFNRTHSLIRWAQRSNMVSVLTDCPHRERLGWLEQYYLNGPSLRYEFGLETLFSKTFQDMADSQLESGLVPDIAPEYIVFNGGFRDSPEWGSAIILAAWQQYLFSGDLNVLEDHYNSMCHYMKYLESREHEDGLIYHGLGDWYDIGPGRPGIAQLTPPGVTASATYFECARTMAKIANLLEKTKDSAAFQELATRLREAFNQTFYNKAEGIYASGSQTANAMALNLGLVPDADAGRVLDALIADIRTNQNAVTAGDIGHVYVLRTLSECGRDDVIYDMHHQEDRPGYGYQLKMGATSLTEAWDANRQSSQNHFMLGHILEWFYGGLVGIQPDEREPGFKHAIIRPKPCGDITWASASHRSTYGVIAASWESMDDLFRISVKIPVNTHSTIYLPAPAGARLYSLNNDEKMEVTAPITNGCFAMETGSGDYIYEVRSGW